MKSEDQCLEEITSLQIENATQVLRFLAVPQNQNQLLSTRFEQFKLALGQYLSRNSNKNKVRKGTRKEKEVKMSKCLMKMNKIEEKQLIVTQLAKANELSDGKRDEYLKQEQRNLFTQGLQPQLQQLKRMSIENQEKLNLISYDVVFNQSCYVCKKKYNEIHFFYDQLCPPCADLNYRKREQKCNLTQKIALVTGGRIKIGYQIALMLLRSGAVTIVTTRFPKDAAMRFSKESDFALWSDRLQIYSIDFRISASVYEFCNFFKAKYDRLDILINNAAQTIQKSASSYQLLIEQETNKDFIIDEQVQKIVPVDFQNNSLTQLLGQKNLYQIEDKLSNPSKPALLQMGGLDLENKDLPQIVDQNNEIVSFNKTNSWVLNLDEISFQEFLEVQAINTFAPFILCSQLKGLMQKSREKPRFIVNVSAMEGQFYRFKKSTHPHTNMAKAALNMMTRTVGSYYAAFDIYMNSADTGWVSNEHPQNLTARYTPPLDEIDGAMRVLDCVFTGYNESNPVHSKFFKDYQETYW